MTSQALIEKLVNTNVIIITTFILLISIIIIICFVLYPLMLFFFFLMPQVKDQQSHSLHLILAYFIFVTTIFRLIAFKYYDFPILL